MTEQPSRYDSTEYLSSPNGFCAGCGVALALRYFLKAMGGRIVLVMPPGCAAPSVLFPRRSLLEDGKPIDIVSSPFGSTAILAGGIKSGLSARGETETQVVVWAGDGATFDIGLSGLSAAAERNEDILYVCYDNEAYMNTGNQRSSATPWGAKTSTNLPPVMKKEGKKDLMWMLMGHGIPYAASATVAYPDDLMTKVRKAKAIQGFRFFHILTPCVPGWGYKPERTVEISRLAVQTRFFPLIEIEGPSLAVGKITKKRELKEFVGAQSRFKHFTGADLLRLEKELETRWARLSHMAGLKVESESHAPCTE